MPTQTSYPWRTVFRSVFQFVVGLAAMAPVLYSTITGDNPEGATGALAVALGIAGALTRVMALPSVNAFLARFAPFLAAEPKAVAGAPVVPGELAKPAAEPAGYWGSVSMTEKAQTPTDPAGQPPTKPA